MGVVARPDEGDRLCGVFSTLGPDGGSGGGCGAERMSRARKPIRVSEKEAKRLEALFGRQDAGSFSEALGELELPASETREDAPGGEKDSWDEDWPGAATHHLSEAIACQGCGEKSFTLVQRLDGIKIGPPLCQTCYVNGLPARRRRGKAVARYRKSTR